MYTHGIGVLVYSKRANGPNREINPVDPDKIAWNLVFRDDEAGKQKKRMKTIETRLATFKLGKVQDKKKIHAAIAMFVMSTISSKSRKALAVDTYPHIQYTSDTNTRLSAKPSGI